MLFILILTTDSWVEPLLVLAGLGAAILINNGTNLMFGTISFVTNAAGSMMRDTNRPNLSKLGSRGLWLVLSIHG